MTARREALSAFRYAPLRHRWRLARKIVALPSAAFDLPPSIATDCEIKSLDQCESGCARLALLLNRSGKTPAPQHLLNLKSLLQRGPFHTGVIGTLDWFFLTAFVSVIAPERVLELGTLTGFSAALLALAVIAERGYYNRPVVETIDPATMCMVVPEPVGFEIAQLLPKYPGAVRVHAGRDSRIVPDLFAPGELMLAFVDANHQHPYPLLDVTRLVPFMRPGGWILLHDISLGTMGERWRVQGEALPYGAPYGAEWLFQAWPFPKISGGKTGAIQLPQETTLLLPFVLNIMRRPFEEEDPQQHTKVRRALYRALAPLARG